jgi:hypothetical protein
MILYPNSLLGQHKIPEIALALLEGECSKNTEPKNIPNKSAQ